jgi:hypothetical protein
MGRLADLGRSKVVNLVKTVNLVTGFLFCVSFLVILTGAPRLEESGFHLPALSMREDTAGQILRSETNAAHRYPLSQDNIFVAFLWQRSVTSDSSKIDLEEVSHSLLWPLTQPARLIFTPSSRLLSLASIKTRGRPRSLHLNKVRGADRLRCDR